MNKSRLVARFLIASGAALLILTGVWAYPYAHSRLVRPASVTVITVPSPGANATGRDAGETQTVQLRTTVLSQTPEPSLTPSPVTLSTPMPTAPSTLVDPEGQGPDPAPPTRIVIPALGVDGPVVPVSLSKTEVEGQVYTAWGVPDEYAAGWHETSALLGEPGNMVLNGHNTNNGEIFRDLYTLDSGERITVYSGKISRTYAVSETLILPEGGQPLEVRLANARYVMPTDEERLTLVTCHPYGSLRNRLIVIARPSTSDASSEPLED